VVSDYLPQLSFLNIEGIYNGANNEIIIVEPNLIRRIQSNGTVLIIAAQQQSPNFLGIADSTGYFPIPVPELSNLVYNPTDNHYYAFTSASFHRCLIRIKADWTGFQSVGFNQDLNISSFDGNYFNGTVNLGNWSVKFLQNNGNNNILYFIEGEYVAKVRRINLNTQTLTTHFYHPSIKGISKIGNKYYVTGLFLAELK
jgi:hypothetical protein